MKLQVPFKVHDQLDPFFSIILQICSMIFWICLDLFCLGLFYFILSFLKHLKVRMFARNSLMLRHATHGSQRNLLTSIFRIFEPYPVKKGYVYCKKDPCVTAQKERFIAHYLSTNMTSCG